jgi:hypothetical protein
MDRQFNGIFNLTFRDILYIKGWPLLGIKLSSGFPANENLVLVGHAGRLWLRCDCNNITSGCVLQVR